MWKNVFIEALLLSVIIFGGFYINASMMTREINIAQENILSEQSPILAGLHLSGSWFGLTSSHTWGNISGNKMSSEHRSSVSGIPHISSNVSGNKA